MSTPFDQMVAQARAELETQPGTISSAMGISIDDARAAWLSALEAENVRITRFAAGMPKSWHMPMSESTQYLAIRAILRDEGRIK